MELDWLQIVIQGGAVALAGVAMWILYKLVGNHLSHNTDALKELSVVLGELRELIKTHIKKD